MIEFKSCDSIFNLTLSFHIKKSRSTISTVGGKQREIWDAQIFAKLGKVERVLIVNFDKVLFTVFSPGSESAYEGMVSRELFLKVT